MSSPDLNAPVPSTWRRKLEELFGLDVRALALLRIGLALVLLWDVGSRAQDLRAHYGGDGVLPLALVPAPGPGLGDNVLPLSLHLIDGSPRFQAGLFVVEALAALALLIGWQTRVATAVAWFLTLSLYTRNPLVCHGGDNVLRLLLFWSLFLPLGAWGSLDRRSRPRPPNRVLSLATAALLLQICELFWFAALLKYDPAWRSDGDAVYRALVIGHLRTPIGDWLLRSRGLMVFLTFATLVQEAVVPFLLFIPWRTWVFRLVVVASFLVFHVALGLCMELGTFHPLCIVGWLALLPTEFFDRLAARVRRPAVEVAPVAAVVPPQPPIVRPLAAATNLAVAFLLLYVTVWNVAAWNEPHAPGKNALLEAMLDVRDAVRSRFRAQNANLGYVLGIDQGAYLFAPKPSLIHGWFVLDGTLVDGTHVDLLPYVLRHAEAELSFLRPKRVADVYPNARWRKYLTNLIAVPPEKRVFRQAFAAYAATEWNRAHADGKSRQLRTLDVVLMQETTQPNYQPLKREKLRLVRLDCRATDLSAASAADLEPAPIPW